MRKKILRFMKRLRKNTLAMRIASYALMVAITFALLMPLIKNADSFLPAGPDAQFNLYVLEQVHKNIMDGRNPYYGQVFHPHENTIAYSSALFPYQALYTPLRLAGVSPNTAFNVLFVCSVLLLLVIVFEFAFSLRMRFFFALAVALFSVFLCVPFYYVSGHFQMFTGYFYLLLIMLVNAYFKSEKWYLLILGALLSLLMFSFDPAIALMGCFTVLMYAIIRNKDTGRVLLNIITKVKRLRVVLPILIISVAALVFIALPYLQEYGASGKDPLEHVNVFSTRSVSIILAPPISFFHDPIQAKWGLDEASHLAGFTFLVLLILGVVYIFTRKKKRYRPYALTALFLYLASFGPTYFHSGAYRFPVNPFFLAPYYLIPGFGAIGSPGRFFFIAFPLFALIVVYMIYHISRSLFKARVRYVAIFIMTALILIEGYAKLPLQKYDYEKRTEYYAELNEHIDSGESIIRLPYERWGSSALVSYMLGLLQTDARSVNGYSGRTTEERSRYDEKNLHVNKALSTAEGAKSVLAFLREDNVRYIVLDKTALLPGERQKIEAELRFLPYVETEYFRIYTIDKK